MGQVTITGVCLVPQIYREGVGASHEVTYTPVPRGEGAPEGDLAGAPVLQRYQPLDSLTYRRLAARRFKTTYCYDFPMLVENALREVWYERASLGEALPVMPHGRLSHFQEVREGLSKVDAAALTALGVARAVAMLSCVAWLTWPATVHCGTWLTMLVTLLILSYTRP